MHPFLVPFSHLSLEDLDFDRQEEVDGDHGVVENGAESTLLLS